ncbi:MAG: hypothetical protein IKB75_07680 [Clostridia bacterium]|nr:hypothetical protein [Clostridia bacterium]
MKKSHTSQRFGTLREEDRLHFYVSADRADYVSVVGDFNDWDPASTPMVKDADGIWEASVATSLLTDGENYKFYLVRDGQSFYRADPFAKRAQPAPETASVIDLGEPFLWTDEGWMQYRRNTFSADGARRAPVSVYRVSLPNWQRTSDGGLLSYESLATELSTYAKQMGYTHVELFPLFGSRPVGNGDSVGTYFAPDVALGTPAEFCGFVRKMHGAGVGVLLDILPSHVAEDASGIRSFDGRPVTKEDEPLLQLLFEELASKYHIDGFLIDKSALEGMEQTDASNLLSSIALALSEKIPDLLLSILSPASDTPLADLCARLCPDCEPLCRAFGEMENRLHTDGMQNFALYKTYLLALLTLPGKKRTLMGREFEGLTNLAREDESTPSWGLLEQDMHADLQRFTAALNHFYLREPALWQEDGFTPLSAPPVEGVCGYLRQDGEGNTRMLLFNTTDRERTFTVSAPSDTVLPRALFYTVEERTALLRPDPNGNDTLELFLPPFGAVILG